MMRSESFPSFLQIPPLKTLRKLVVWEGGATRMKMQTSIKEGEEEEEVVVVIEEETCTLIIHHSNTTAQDFAAVQRMCCRKVQARTLGPLMVG
jgi:hypothetical protein